MQLARAPGNDLVLNYVLLFAVAAQLQQLPLGSDTAPLRDEIVVFPLADLCRSPCCGNTAVDGAQSKQRDEGCGTCTGAVGQAGSGLGGLMAYSPGQGLGITMSIGCGTELRQNQSKGNEIPTWMAQHKRQTRLRPIWTANHAGIMCETKGRGLLITRRARAF